MADDATLPFQLVAPKRRKTSELSRCVPDKRDQPLEEAGEAEEVGAGTEELFKELGLRRWLCTNAASMGMREPSSVQRACIPRALEGKDILGCSATGSGKTAAFALPILQKLGEDPYGVFCLVLTPARELASQVAGQFRALGKGINLECAEVVGGADYQRQAVTLTRRPHIIVGTPGRIHDHLRTHEDAGPSLRGLSFLVLDEADRLLAESFEGDLSGIIPWLPRNRQTMLFSATMTASIAQLREMTMRKAAQYIESGGRDGASPVPEKLSQRYCLVPARVKEAYVAHIASRLTEFAEGPSSGCLVFVKSCEAAQLVAEMLAELGISAAPIHAALPQRHRHASLHRFKSGAVSILVATDVAARGLDIPEVGLVLNRDLPRDPKDYIHRVGRTARNGNPGAALSLVSQGEVARLRAVEGELGHRLEQSDLREENVLKRLGRSFAAKRAASLRVNDPDGFQAHLQEYKSRKHRKKGGHATVREV